MTDIIETIFLEASAAFMYSVYDNSNTDRNKRRGITSRFKRDSTSPKGQKRQYQSQRPSGIICNFHCDVEFRFLVRVTVNSFLSYYILFGYKHDFFF